MDIKYLITSKAHSIYADQLCKAYQQSAQARGTGIALRKKEYLCKKMEKGQAIIALHQQQLAGFCYIETWEHGKYVANSGLIVIEAFRKKGVATQIKSKAFELARITFPNAQVFGITTSATVMKINWELGYRPTSFAELTKDDAFWEGCQSCPNYNILQKNKRLLCLCTAMIAPPLELPNYDLSDQVVSNQTSKSINK